jgi:hypothetical protein
MKPWYDAYQEEKFQVKENSITDWALTDKEWCQKYLGTSTATIDKRHCSVVSEVIEKFSPAVLAKESTDQVEKYRKKYGDRTGNALSSHLNRGEKTVFEKAISETTDKIQEMADKVMEKDGSPKVDLTKQPTHFSGMFEQHSEKVDDKAIYGECARHPGNNMVDCIECSTEEATIGDIGLKTKKSDFEKLEEPKDKSRKLQDKVAQPDKETVKRPPLGVIPRFIYEEKRREHLKDGMIRFLEAGKKLNDEWIDEYNELTDKIDARQRLEESKAKK